MATPSHDLTPLERRRQSAAERGGLAFLVYRDAAGAQRLLTLEGERVCVGRATENELALDWDREASRVHAVLERLGGSWTVVDDDLSRNGTFVNGMLSRGRRRLCDHDVLRFGSTRVLYRDPGEEAESTAPAGDPATAVRITAGQRRVLVELCRPLAATSPAVPPSNSEIAARLTVSVEAVRTHLKALFKVFEVEAMPQSAKRVELARRAMASGVVGPRDLPR